jgi:hypothetical protein
MGVRLRERTTHLFEGLFEPGPRPPADKPEDKKPEEKRPE